MAAVDRHQSCVAEHDYSLFVVCVLLFVNGDKVPGSVAQQPSVVSP
ncbi:hypothetical protein [Methylocystis sp.]